MTREKVRFTDRYLKAVWLALMVGLVFLSSACLFTTEPEHPQETNEDGTPLIRELKVFAIPSEAASFMLNPRPVGDQGYVFGVEVTINALPEEGWELVEWVGPVYDETDKNAKIAMTGSRTVVARLQPVESLAVVPPTPTPVSTPVPTVVTQPTVMVPTPTPVREKCVDLGIAYENHLFHGHAGGTAISVIVKDTQVVVATAEGGTRGLSAPYVLAIPVCDGEGWSLVGENVGFKLDGNLARQNVSLRAGGLDKLDLFTTQIAPAKRPTPVPTPTVSYEPTATPPSPLTNRPGAPTNVVASYDPNGVRVSWTPPTYTGGSKIQNYTVGIFPSNLGLNAHGGSTSVLVPGSYLQAGIAYSFTVTAFNANGNGDESQHSNDAVFTGIQSASAPAPTPTRAPIPTATRVPTPTSTPVPYSGVGPTPTPVPTPTPTPIPSVVTVPTATPVPRATPIPTPTPTPTPTPSPGSQLSGRFAFSSYLNGNHEIYIMDANGTNLRNVTNFAGPDEHPHLSRDGSKITFISQRGTGSAWGNSGIFLMNSDGTNVVRLTNTIALPAGQRFPHWSPDGSKIVFDGYFEGDECVPAPPCSGHEIYSINEDGSGATRLTANISGEENPVWSPDGSRIAFVSTRPFGSTASTDIYSMNIDGSDQINLTNSLMNEFGPSWSPDGSKIAYFAEPEGNNGNREIYTMNADGSSQMRLTNNAANDRGPVWSPGGSKIAFSRDGSLYIMNIDGSEKFLVPTNVAVSRLSWSQ